MVLGGGAPAGRVVWEKSLGPTRTFASEKEPGDHTCFDPVATLAPPAFC
jgi:hypothetical protein